jgi:hypothetical protein
VRPPYGLLLNTFPRTVKRAACICTILASCLLAATLSACGSASSTISPHTGDAFFAEAFAAHAGGLECEGRGTVARLLPDDTGGDRHQRFIVTLSSGQTLLIAHNINVASPVEGLEVGDSVSFKGEYEWNVYGGLVHWTHRDPGGSHVAGWVELEGNTFQ